MDSLVTPPTDCKTANCQHAGRQNTPALAKLSRSTVHTTSAFKPTQLSKTSLATKPNWQHIDEAALRLLGPIRIPPGASITKVTSNRSRVVSSEIDRHSGRDHESAMAINLYRSQIASRRSPFTGHGSRVWFGKPRRSSAGIDWIIPYVKRAQAT